MNPNPQPAVQVSPIVVNKIIFFAPIALALFGLVAIVFAAKYDTAPYGTHNIGEIQSQTMWMMFGGICVIVSAILFASNRIVNAITAKRAKPRPPVA